MSIYTNLHSGINELYAYLYIILKDFPPEERNCMTRSIRTKALDLVTDLVVCRKNGGLKSSILNLDTDHEKLRCMINLANELDFFAWYEGGRKKRAVQDANKRYTHTSVLLNKIGVLIGTLVKTVK